MQPHVGQMADYPSVLNGVVGSLLELIQHLIFDESLDEHVAAGLLVGTGQNRMFNLFIELQFDVTPISQFWVQIGCACVCVIISETHSYFLQQFF